MDLKPHLYVIATLKKPHLNHLPNDAILPVIGQLPYGFCIFIQLYELVLRARITENENEKKKRIISTFWSSQPHQRSTKLVASFSYKSIGVI